MNVIKRPIDKFTMILCPEDNGISTALMTQGYREAVFMHLIKENIKQGDTCLDLGANIGYATLFMADNCGPSGKVYAVEPDPHNIILLRENISENNFDERCEIEQCLISNTNGSQDFWIADAPNLNSVSKTKRSVKSISVPSYDLPNFLQDKECPNFIKMDVEGHEVQILDAGLEYFTKQETSIKILLEVHPQFYNEENNFAKTLEKYFENGFSTKYVTSTPVAQPLKFKEANYEPITSFNTDGAVRGLYDCVSNEKLIEFSCYENKEGASKKIVRSFMIEKI